MESKGLRIQRQVAPDLLLINFFYVNIQDKQDVRTTPGSGGLRGIRIPRRLFMAIALAITLKSNFCFAVANRYSRWGFALLQPARRGPAAAGDGQPCDPWRIET